MAFSDRSYNRSYIGAFFPQGVKWLLISNIALFIIYFFANVSGYGYLFEPFALVPRDVLTHLALWQFVTYLFLHDPFGFGHILINMLTLWMFGQDLERDWGTRFFLKYYFVCGIGAGICVVVANVLFSPTLNVHTIGASGAIYGLLLAFGMLYPDRQILFSFLFPIKAKYFVMIMGGIAFLSNFSPTGGAVSHVAHLGGMIFGYGYLRQLRRGRRLRNQTTWLGNVRTWWQDYKRQRARKKFEVYMRKNPKYPSDRDRFVH